MCFQQCYVVPVHSKFFSDTGSNTRCLSEKACNYDDLIPLVPLLGDCEEQIHHLESMKTMWGCTTIAKVI